jgi:hypothetical protein
LEKEERMPPEFNHLFQSLSPHLPSQSSIFFRYLTSRDDDRFISMRLNDARGFTRETFFFRATADVLEGGCVPGNL